MKEMLKYPSIERFDSVYHRIKSNLIYHWQVKNNKEYIDEPLEFPTISFRGTEKLHGTNMCVAYNHEEGLWVQSRERILSVVSDNEGCCFAVEANKEHWIGVINYLAAGYGIDININTIYIDAEWVGGSIQRGNSALSGHEKCAFIFSEFRVLNHETQSTTYYHSQYIQDKEHGIFNINNFSMYHITVDFNDIAAAIEELNRITTYIEDASPIGKTFGFESNIGEGVVWKGGGFIFKAKGEKHGGKPKVRKEQTEVAVEEVAKLKELATRLTPVWRITQGIKETNATSMKEFGSLIKWISLDILKEDLHIIADANTTWKDVQKYVTKEIKEYYENSMHL